MTEYEARSVRKTYAPTIALHGADITVQGGMVHGLLGENGAGKSTLVKIMTGGARPDSGDLFLNGRPVTFSNVTEAVESGVAVVTQEFSLFPHLDVLSNLFPMREPRRGPFIDRAEMATRAVPILEQLKVDVPLRWPVERLTLAQRQLVEIAKALLTEPSVLVLDEPTSALEAGSRDTLLSILRVLRDRNVGVLFVSHILEEVMGLCDVVTVLRNGHVVVEGVPMSEMAIDDLVEAITGRRNPPQTRQTRKASTEGRVVLRFEDVTVGRRLRGASFEVRQGELVGLAGLVGSGNEEALKVAAGMIRPQAGSVTLKGGPLPKSVAGVVRAGAGFVSGDRHRFGIAPDKPVWWNIAQVRAMALVRDGLIIRIERLRERAWAQVERLGIRTPSSDVAASHLSGGNQQKVAIAKWLDAEQSVMFLDDPTRGVDIGARNEIHRVMREMVESGATLVMASTDLEELILTCDRILVFYRGRVCAELKGDDLDVPTLLEVMNIGRLPSASTSGTAGEATSENLSPGA